MTNIGQFQKGHTPWIKGKTKIDFPQLRGGRKKGFIPWNKGKKMSEEYCEGCRKINLGRKASEETKKKLSLMRRGSDNANWKGGITPLILSCRTCIKYKEWHQSVFERDNWTCQECGKNGGIVAHHIKQFAQIFYDNNLKTIKESLNCTELWDITNGLTVCVRCHKEIFHPNGNQYQPTLEATGTKG